MKILMVASYLPYPLFSGGHIRLYNLIKELSKKHSITLVCEKRKNQTQRDIDAVNAYCEEVVVVDRPSQWSIQNIIKTGFSTMPFLLVGHTNQQLKEKIKSVLEEKKIDLIHIETFYVMQNLPHTSIPVVLVEHNIEYLVYKRFTQTTPFFIRPLLYLDVFKLQRWEQYFWEKADTLVAVSEKEKRIMDKQNVYVVPNGVDLNEFKPHFQKNDPDKKILFIGNFKWLQNRDSLRWILDELWPSIKKNTHGKLWVVGQNIPNVLKKKMQEMEIEFDEHLTSTTEVFKKSYILLSPIRIGGGTSYKILEAMASGVPVITTSLGAEGLLVKNNENIIIENVSESIIEKTISLLSDNKYYKNIAMNARVVVEKNYDWEKIAKKLEGLYSITLQKK